MWAFFHKNQQLSNFYCQFIAKAAYYVADLCENLLEEIRQAPQMSADIFLSVCTASLVPGHSFIQPKLHLLSIQQRLWSFLELAQWLLQLCHVVCAGKLTSKAKKYPIKHKTRVKHKCYRKEILHNLSLILFNFLVWELR